MMTFLKENDDYFELYEARVKLLFAIQMQHFFESSWFFALIETSNRSIKTFRFVISMEIKIENDVNLSSSKSLKSKTHGM